jgi:DNA-directed RNA polymerase subunit beta
MLHQPRYLISDFIEIQRSSFFNLLKKGIITEFSKRNPMFSTKKEIEVYFYPEYYRLVLPTYSEREAISNSKSYASRIYIPIQLSFRNSHQIRLKWIYIGDLPLMTKRGHFILNGAPRIIMNQIIRSPGIYFQEKIHEGSKTKKYWQTGETPPLPYKRYFADLICLSGTWLRLEIDKEKKIWAQTKKGVKIPIFWFLIALGLSERFIFNSVIDPERLLENIDCEDYDYLSDAPLVWKQIFGLIYPKREEKEENAMHLARRWLYSKFMNPKNYDLSRQGRVAFNKKLGLNIDLNHQTLTSFDLLYATDYLLKVEKGLKEIDDIDHLKNRRVRTSGELIQIQIALGIARLEKNVTIELDKIQEKISDKSKLWKLNSRSEFYDQEVMTKEVLLRKSKKRNTKSESKKKELIKAGFESDFFPGETFENKSSLGSQSTFIQMDNIVDTTAFNSALREFFGTSPLSQFMDQINPLAELTHKRRLSSMGPGGVSRDSATLAIRGIHPTHYGRICGVETPEGKNTGLVNSLTTYARVSPLGLLESPFYKVYKGIVLKNVGLIYFSADQEEKIKLAAPDLFVSSLGFLPNMNLPIRIGNSFVKAKRHEVEYIGVSPLQMISIATSLIPFLEHDDGNRALMGSNMQRQAVPLIRAERPIVGTGLESRAVSDVGHIVQAKFSGMVTYASARSIRVLTIKNNPLNPLFLSLCDKSHYPFFDHFYPEGGNVIYRKAIKTTGKSDEKSIGFGNYGNYTSQSSSHIESVSSSSKKDEFNKPLQNPLLKRVLEQKLPFSFSTRKSNRFFKINKLKKKIDKEQLENKTLLLSHNIGEGGVKCL